MCRNIFAQTDASRSGEDTPLDSVPTTFCTDCNYSRTYDSEREEITPTSRFRGTIDCLTGRDSSQPFDGGYRSSDESASNSCAKNCMTQVTYPRAPGIDLTFGRRESEGDDTASPNCRAWCERLSLCNNELEIHRRITIVTTKG